MSTYLAGRIRAVAADPHRAALRELPEIAVAVERLELRLDEFFQQAREDARITEYYRTRMKEQVY